LLGGALALVLVNLATLVVAGRPWGITSAFALWGAKVAALAGADVQSWVYWRDDAALTTTVLADPTSVMDMTIMIGAFGASGLAGRFSPKVTIQPRLLVASLFGGLLMGLGARLSTGCNIGAFFSGIASGSFHGLVWLIFAVAGTVIGVRLRPYFGMSG